MPRWPLTPRERFETTINKQENGCWLWTGCGAGNGYGSAYFNGRSEGAHRVSYKIYKGGIPDGLQINHKCDVPRCVNPDHLYAGTHQENMKDVCDRNRRQHVPKRLGEENSNSKVTKEMAHDIQVYYASKSFTQQELANMYSLSQTGISRIIRKQYLL